GLGSNVSLTAGCAQLGTPGQVTILAIAKPLFDAGEQVRQLGEPHLTVGSFGVLLGSLLPFLLHGRRRGRTGRRNGLDHHVRRDAPFIDVARPHGVLFTASLHLALGRLRWRLQLRTVGRGAALAVVAHLVAVTRWAGSQTTPHAGDKRV